MHQNLLKLSSIIILTAFIFNSCSDSGEEPDPCQNGPSINIDNIAISIEGESNGEIRASASSGQVPYMFSIDGTNFQSSGTFSNLAGDNYTVTVKDANNCTDSQMATVREVPEVSYVDEISPIIATNCQLATCHGDNANIPSFATYADVSTHADNIKTRTTEKTMPPNGALDDADIQLIADWVDQGAPNN